MNKQSIIKTDHEAEKLRLHSIFYTIQGEGPFVGRPALFVRLHGCNLKCYWCDTEYTEKMRLYETKTLVERIFANLQLLPSNTIVVLTGGEPMSQNITELCQLVSDHYVIQLETNGTVVAPNFPFWKKNIHVVVSPKTGKVDPEIEKNVRHIDAFKYVVEWDDLTENGLPSMSTQVQGKKLPLYVPGKATLNQIYVSPKDDENQKANMKHAANIAMKHGYTLSLQTHKIVGVE